MNPVSNFVQIRTDGKIVPAEMKVQEMLSLGWTPSKVTSLRWNHGSEEVKAAGPYGIHGIVVPGANFVAAVVDVDVSGMSTQLEIRAADGSLHGCVENRVTMLEREFKGSFQWFEPAMSPAVDTFGAVFQTETDGAFRCDVEAQSLRVSGVARLR